MNRNFMVNCPRTPAPVRNSSFLTSAAAVLETPTLLRKPGSSSTNGNENVARSTPTLQPPSAASTAAMQFLMFNQMQSAAFTSSSNGGTPFQRSAAGKTGLVNGTSGFNFTIPNIPDSTTTVTTRIIENLQISNSNAPPLKRKHDEGYGNAKLPAKRVQFEPLPLKPRNQANDKRWSSKAALPALTAGPSKQPSPPAESSKSDGKKLRILTGSVEHIMKLSKTSPGGSPLVEVFANVLTIKAGAYECEKILLLRNRTGPVMQGVFYEIDFHMPPVNVGDLVRCVGRLTGGSRLQILKITLATPEEERMGHRLQTVSGFVVAVQR